jgi:hypothetical protein
LAQKGFLMKKSPLLFAALLCAAAVQAAPQPDLIARIYFAGAEKISADTNSIAFTNEFCSAEARALRGQTLDKLSAALAGWLGQKTGAGVPRGASKLRPLLGDLEKTAWFLEARVAADGRPGVALAVKLDGSRAQFWRANLSPFFASADFRQSGGWLVFDCGEDGQKIGGSLPQKISAAGGNWLDVDLNWPRLAQFFPALKSFDFPEMRLQAVGRAGNFNLDGKFILSQPLPPLEKWRLPANTVHPPFDSFTAARGFAPWLGRQSWALPYEISPPPGQIFVWALPYMPLQTFAAVPVPDSNSALAQLGAKLSAVPETAAPAGSFTPFRFTTVMTNNQIVWRGVPFIGPFVKPLHETAGDFLFGGFFPNTPRPKPLPPELSAQLNRPGLVYYHWEMTGARLKQLPQLTQLALLFSERRQLDGQSAAGKWLNQIGPSLGASVTEITETAPDELAFTRKSPGGLNALEFIALANWLEAPDFPGCDLKLKFSTRPMNLKRPLPAQKPGAPSAQPFVLHQ